MAKVCVQKAEHCIGIYVRTSWRKKERTNEIKQVKKKCFVCCLDGRVDNLMHNNNSDLVYNADQCQFCSPKSDKFQTETQSGRASRLFDYVSFTVNSGFYILKALRMIFPRNCFLQQGTTATTMKVIVTSNRENIFLWVMSNLFCGVDYMMLCCSGWILFNEMNEFEQRNEFEAEYGYCIFRCLFWPNRMPFYPRNERMPLQSSINNFVAWQNSKSSSARLEKKFYLKKTSATFHWSSPYDIETKCEQQTFFIYKTRN